LTEDALVQALRDALGAPARKLVLGIGDDAAAWKPGKHHLSLITTDMLVDGIHFRLAETPPQSLGHKALAQNLSDIAAMGGSAMLCVIALGIPEHIEEPWLRELYRGLAALAERTGCAVAGGDIVRSAYLCIGITVVGEVKHSRMKTRAGARAGDVAAVSGPLGLSAAGLRLIDARRQSAVSPLSAQRLTQAYLEPQARCREGVFFGACKAVRAMMDISDGLSTDLARMARASNVDAVLSADALTPDAALLDVARVLALDARELMLNGGDDYELLVAVEPRAYSHVARGFQHRFRRPLRALGKFQTGRGRVWLQDAAGRHELKAGGHDHLRV
jgi:thiamine-monophosphate kinase